MEWFFTMYFGEISIRMGHLKKSAEPCWKKGEVLKYIYIILRGKRKFMKQFKNNMATIQQNTDFFFLGTWPLKF